MMWPLLPYQARWVTDKAGLKVIVKSRRIGLSWAEAYDSVLHAAGGTGDVYYQSYNKDMTEGFISDAAGWAEELGELLEPVGETVIDPGPNEVQAYRLRTSSGKAIYAMTSAPRAFRSRGRPGDRAIIDEAAFVDDLDAVLKAALAFRMWGGEVHVISTHNGESSPFAALCGEVEDGVRSGSLHLVTFADALSDGLYRRICEVSGVTWTPESEAAWEAEIRRTYGEDAGEELDCIPAKGKGPWLSWELIKAAEHEDAGDPELYTGGLAYIGVDVARRSHLWVACVLERVLDVLWTRELVVRQGISFAEQRAIVADLFARYRVLRCAVDQTGMGEAFVEQLQEAHGERVEGVLMTQPRRLDLATALLDSAEGRRLRTPAGDEDLRRDLYAVRKVAGATGAPRLVADGRGTDGHSDRFWAYGLAAAAAFDQDGPMEGHVATRPAVAASLDQPDGGEPLGLVRDYDRGIVWRPTWRMV